MSPPGDEHQEVADSKGVARKQNVQESTNPDSLRMVHAHSPEDPDVTAAHTAPTASTAPITSMSTSPQSPFFGIHELVSEVVGYLSSSREDVFKCLYVSRTFYTAAIPLVYKYIPIGCLDIVNPALKDRYLRTVVAPSVIDCTGSMLEHSAQYPTFFERPGTQSYTAEKHGWLAISKTQANVVLHFCDDEHDWDNDWVGRLLSVFEWGPNILPPLNSIQSSTSIDPNSTTMTITLVLVPPYISGQDVDVDSFYPYEYAAIANDLFEASNLGDQSHLARPRAITIVGLEFHDPFTGDFIDLQTSFLNAVDDFYMDHYRDTFTEARENLIHQIQYMTFKEYIETSDEWKNVLDWRNVGEWLNKCDESEAEEESRVGKEVKNEIGAAKADEGKSHRSCSPVPPMAHLPRAQ